MINYLKASQNEKTNLLTLYTFTCFRLFIAPPALSAEADLVKAEKVYKRSCATCHGKQGEKPAMGESKIINQLKPEEISTALSERKAGNIPSAGSPANNV